MVDESVGASVGETMVAVGEELGEEVGALVGEDVVGAFETNQPTPIK